MKTTLLTSLISVALALGTFAQSPAASPDSAATASPPAAATAPAGTSPSPTAAGDLESQIERKVRRGLSITFGDDDKKDRKHDGDTIHFGDGELEDVGALAAIPIVAIIFGSLSLFGAPVLVVAAIMFFSYLKQRSLHRTVRMMVEKGQPVPPALFAPPPTVRARSDMRRGVVLVMVGLGMMLFFAAVNDWEGGAWAIGLIPFLIGAGYLTVWKLEGNKPGVSTTNGNTSTDNPPPLP